MFTDNGLDDRPTGADAAHSVDLALMFVDPDKGILLQEYQPIHQVGGQRGKWEGGVCVARLRSGANVLHRNPVACGA